MFTSQQVFAFRDYAFYFRMLKNTIDNLIDTGQMEFLLRKYYPNSQRFDNIYNGPKVLAMSDLQSGFFIWIGCCCLSIFVFIIEHQESNLRNTDAIFLAQIIISYFQNLYHNDQEPLNRINQDQLEKVDTGESEEDDELKTIISNQNETIEIDETDKNSQDQRSQNINQNNNLITEVEERKTEVVVEVHQADDMEESLEYFENIIAGYEKRQNINHENDAEALSSFIDIELFGEASISQETIE